MRKRERESSGSSKSSSDSLFSSSSDYRNDTRGKRKHPRYKNKDSESNNDKPKPAAATWEKLAERKALLETRDKEISLLEQRRGARNSNDSYDDDDDDDENAWQHHTGNSGELKGNHHKNSILNSTLRVDENFVLSDEDSGDDPFGAAASTPSEGEADTGEKDGDIEDFRERLLAHVQLTCAAKRVGTVDSTVAGVTPAHALQHLKEELLKPVMSTALTVVSATDESHDLMAEIVSAKLPPPPPEDVKRLRKLQYVDHSTIQYPHIRKEFYVAPPDVKDLDADELKRLIAELDGAKLRGRDPPRPMRTWNGSGLPDSVLDLLAREGFEQPFAVQSLGSPALMSGRDLLITAKTGSGKTLAYLLPLIRHCVGQEPCGKGEGPIGLIFVPTRELAAQIAQLAEKLCVAAKLRFVSSYGLTPLADNIRHCRAGCEVMVCTPGRLLDLLTVNGGAVISLRRTSFVVIDEADRMFDSGFMEHVEAFLKNIRPDRQLALISATMPKELKKVIIRHMQDPVEVTVGGKPTPASNVEQRFFFFDEEVYEVEEANRTEDKKFLKLLQILSDEGGTGQHLIIIFAQRKEECDELFARLSACGYQKRIAVLYSGMDPLDREFALEHFAPGNQFILIATGVAERGLDIPYLELVINYTLPDHYEAYVHRIGRTGRAGKKGKAVSFFMRGKDDDLSVELCEGLERAQQQVPEELYERAAKLREKRKEGIVRHNTGFYRGYMKAKKLRFTDRGQEEQFKAAARAAGLEEYLSASSCTDSDLSDGDEDGKEDGIEIVAVQEDGTRGGGGRNEEDSTALMLYRDTSALTLSSQQQQEQQERLASALAYARKTTDSIVDPSSTCARFEAEYPINDLPERIRLRMQSANLLRSVQEETGTTIIRKGVFFDRKYKHSHRLREGVRPLYLLLIGKTVEAVRAAVKKLNEIKEEAQSRIQNKVSALGAEL
ncbi:ATP-dependent DEAD/H RNA helicase [Trypanosoma cruzi]|nr:ATP-dependent DEAD/H RNA helicase [Trypanosoma cruzi]